MISSKLPSCLIFILWDCLRTILIYLDTIFVISNQMGYNCCSIIFVNREGSRNLLLLLLLLFLKN